jgi:hypothetical protein
MMRNMPNLPAQANARATQALEARRPMPTQAGGGVRPDMPAQAMRPMKKGGKVKGYAQGGIYKAEMGQPPVDVDGASAGMDKKPRPVNKTGSKVAVKPAKKYAKGGSIDGCAVKGKTKGRFI